MWIEIVQQQYKKERNRVEARESLVDRNTVMRMTMATGSVEARESLVDRNTRIFSKAYPAPVVEARESLVDRNLLFCTLFSKKMVEARESLVDRNRQETGVSRKSGTSRLARALWIEIEYHRCGNSGPAVEARESLVDRNKCLL